MIKKDKVVTLNYRLKDENLDGTLIEETYGKNPLVFLYGAGGMLPKFEENISGLKQGDKFSFTIKASEAYGETNEQAIIEVSKEAFNNDKSLIQLGKSLPMQDKDGNKFDGIIVEIKDESVMMDFNHPLAGVNLFFEGDVVDVRDATHQELDHGHVHDGEHHH